MLPAWEQCLLHAARPRTAGGCSTVGAGLLHEQHPYPIRAMQMLRYTTTPAATRTTNPSSTTTMTTTPPSSSPPAARHHEQQDDKQHHAAAAAGCVT
ncbi:hypothetical protein OK006_9479 [Actinobacteria bacterium OK006]|nr:hypothetical protein OK006_9479 [Actinobacteria bacterium OK006]